ncbi:MAG: hypothetical protein COA42_02270 [Alteromonadaceae bacterium]|nr:MAG: hypothetical protein COA42_02270 [Alteromonadaceae bacterium]
MIDNLAKQLYEDISQKIADVSQSASAPASQVRAIVESALKKFNLVTRDEFDAQQAVLLRTREKLEALEALVAQLETQMNDAPNSNTESSAPSEGENLSADTEANTKE